MKILLLMPPCPPNLYYPPGVHPRLYPPLGIGYIAAVLEKNGYVVEVADLYLKKWTSIYHVLRDKYYDIIGISCIFPNRTGVYSLIQYISNMHPETKIILGGPFATVMAERLAALPSVAAVVVGEGEFTTLDLVNAIRDAHSFRTVKGIVFREGGQVIKTESWGYIENLDALPFPAFHLFDLKSYRSFWPGNINPISKLVRDKIKGTRWAPVLTTRSCEFKCQFCAVHITSGDKPRSRSGKNVADEFEILQREYGYKAIFLQDASFPIGSDLSRQLCNNLLKRNLRITWGTNARADSATRESLELMKESGCCILLFGLESGSQEILKNINKRETLEQIIETIQVCKSVGIDVGIHILLGYPGENEKTVEKTIEVVKKLRKYIKTLFVRRLAIFPGTELYHKIISEGLMHEDDFFKPSPYFFIPYTLENSNALLKRWKARIESAAKPFYFIKRVSSFLSKGRWHGLDGF